jgi:hypothetical protein
VHLWLYRAYFGRNYRSAGNGQRNTFHTIFCIGALPADCDCGKLCGGLEKIAGKQHMAGGRQMVSKGSCRDNMPYGDIFCDFPFFRNLGIRSEWHTKKQGN